MEGLAQGAQLRQRAETEVVSEPFEFLGGLSGRADAVEDVVDAATGAERGRLALDCESAGLSVTAPR